MENELDYEFLWNALKRYAFTKELEHASKARQVMLEGNYFQATFSANLAGSNKFFGTLMENMEKKARERAKEAVKTPNKGD